jgi:flagellar hook assembly protein FlgD
VNLPKDGNASIVLTDLNGKIIREIYKGNLTKGTHNFKLEGTNLQAGRYFIVLKFDGKTFSRPVHYLP